MANTKIEWSEKVWNPVTGCDKISQGCKNCYAETIANRFWKERKFTDVICHEDRLEQPLHWKKPRMIFVNSMSDLFHEDVPFEFIDQILRVMAFAPQHIYQILTKRPHRLKIYYDYLMTRLREKQITNFSINDNIWIGISAEDQPTFEQRMNFLGQIPAEIRWASLEPLLGNIDISKALPFLNWVVVGGESGPKARGCNVFWIKNIVDQCKAAKVPVFVKQLGAKPYFEEIGFLFNGVKITLDDVGSKGQVFENFPTVVKYREYPNQGDQNNG